MIDLTIIASNSFDSCSNPCVLALFEKLRHAWEARKNELEARVGVIGTQVQTLQMQTQAAGSLGYAGYMQVQQYQQELMRIQEVSICLRILVSCILYVLFHVI